MGPTRDIRALLWSAAPGRNDWTNGYRLACALLIPVAAGVAVGYPRLGLLVGVGAFIVGNAKPDASYRQRMWWMVPATFCVAVLTMLGMAAGTNRPAVVVIGALVLLLGGLAAALGRDAALLGMLVSFGYVIGVAAAGLNVLDVVLPVALGGVFAMVLTWLEAATVHHRTDELPEPWSNLVTRRRVHLDTAVVRRSAALAIAGGIALAVVPFTPNSGGVWLVTGALVVLKPGYQDTVRSAVLRAGGAVAGAVAAGAVAATVTGVWMLLAVALAGLIVTEAVSRRSLALFVVLIAPLSVLLSNVLVRGDWSAAYLRTTDIAVGAGIAIIVAIVLYPHRWLQSAADHEEAAARPP